MKLRVRALESERSFQRVAAVQKTIGSVSLFISLYTKVKQVTVKVVYFIKNGSNGSHVEN